MNKSSKFTSKLTAANESGRETDTSIHPMSDGGGNCYSMRRGVSREVPCQIHGVRSSQLGAEGNDESRAYERAGAEISPALSIPSDEGTQLGH